MNKFKRLSEYQAEGPPPMPSIAAKIIPIETPKSGEWECIGCADRAVLLHRGTAYCRGCYDKRNYDGTLIG